MAAAANDPIHAHKANPCVESIKETHAYAQQQFLLHLSFRTAEAGGVRE